MRRESCCKPGEDFVLGLPVAVVLAQRLRLPTIDRDEFVEMVRIQIEKAMPYATEEMTTDSELISQTEEGSVISAVAVHNEKLSELAAPLLSLGLLPTQVTVYAAQRAATHAPVGAPLLIYPESDAIVCAIAEEGKRSREIDGRARIAMWGQVLNPRNSHGVTLSGSADSPVGSHRAFCEDSRPDPT